VIQNSLHSALCLYTCDAGMETTVHTAGVCKECTREHGHARVGWGTRYETPIRRQCKQAVARPWLPSRSTRPPRRANFKRRHRSESPRTYEIIIRGLTYAMRGGKIMATLHEAVQNSQEEETEAKFKQNRAKAQYINEYQCASLPIDCKHKGS
jgi:hypothetical protein